MTVHPFLLYEHVLPQQTSLWQPGKSRLVAWLDLCPEQRSAHMRPENPKGCSRRRQMQSLVRVPPLGPSPVSSAIVYLNYICLLSYQPTRLFVPPKDKGGRACYLLLLQQQFRMSSVTLRVQWHFCPRSQLPLPSVSILKSPLQKGRRATSPSHKHTPLETSCLSPSHLLGV